MAAGVWISRRSSSRRGSTTMRISPPSTVTLRRFVRSSLSRTTEVSSHSSIRASSSTRSEQPPSLPIRISSPSPIPLRFASGRPLPATASPTTTVTWALGSSARATTAPSSSRQSDPDSPRQEALLPSKLHLHCLLPLPSDRMIPRREDRATGHLSLAGGAVARSGAAGGRRAHPAPFPRHGMFPRRFPSLGARHGGSPRSLGPLHRRGGVRRPRRHQSRNAGDLRGRGRNRGDRGVLARRRIPER